MSKRYTIIDGVGCGFLVIDQRNGECMGWFATRYAADKARRSSGSTGSRKEK